MKKYEFRIKWGGLIENKKEVILNHGERIYCNSYYEDDKTNNILHLTLILAGLKIPVASIPASEVYTVIEDNDTKYIADEPDDK